MMIVSAGASSVSLSTLTDVSALTPSNGDILRYNTSTGKWTNGRGDIIQLKQTSLIVDQVALSNTTQWVDLPNLSLTITGVVAGNTLGIRVTGYVAPHLNTCHFAINYDGVYTQIAGAPNELFPMSSEIFITNVTAGSHIIKIGYACLAGGTLYIRPNTIPREQLYLNVTEYQV